MFRKRHLIFTPLLLAGGLRAEVLINEAAFDEPTGSPDWVELYNAGPAAVSVDGWRLSDEDAAAGKEAVIRLPVPVPPGGFLVVHLDADGPDETDFSDGRADVYSGTSTTVSLAATEDELSLYSGAPSSATLVDFVAWVTDGRYDGAGDQAQAVAAGLWAPGAAVVLADGGHGYSLGRISDGVDTDGTGDFTAFSAPTPGASNAPGPPPPPPEPPRPRDVVINEVAWGGTAASPSHEWIELFNASTRAFSLDGWRLASGDGDMDVLLGGPLPPGGYYLMERTSDAPVADLPADRVYTGSLSNGGEDLLLLDASSATVDAAPFSGGWPGGSGAPDFVSLERVTPSADGDLRSAWRSNDGSARNGLDAAGHPINGTPRARNAVFSPLLPSSGGASQDPPPVPGGRLSIDPAANPFSPADPDPARRAARISFDAGFPDAVKTLRIADVRGEVVRTFSESDGLSSAPAGLVAWDGKDAGGRPAPPGIYLVYFEAVAPASGGRTRGKGTVVLGYPR